MLLFVLHFWSKNAALVSASHFSLSLSLSLSLSQNKKLPNPKPKKKKKTKTYFEWFKGFYWFISLTFQL